MKASEVMTRGVITVAPETPIREVARILLERGFSAVPVVDPSGVPLGVVSEGDFAHRPELGTEWRRSWWLAYVADPNGGAAEFLRGHGRTAGDVMHRGIVAVRPDRGLDEIVDLIDRRRIKRVFVVDGDTIVGVITRADLLRAFASTCQPAAARRDDLEIRSEIDSRMRAASWAPRALVTPLVADGVVELLGIVGSNVEREAVKLLVSEIPGVRRIEDHLTVRPMPLALAGMVA